MEICDTLYMENVEELKEKHKDLIQEYIDSTQKILNLPFKLEWHYFENEDVNVFAYHKNFQIYVNMNSVIDSVNKNEPKWIEYFIIHETFHLFQKLSIQRNDQNPVVEQWKYEFDNYIKPTEDKEKYYLQRVEFDAFAYAYAVMLYKYKSPSYIKFPQFYYMYDDIYSHFNTAVNFYYNKLKNATQN